MALPPEIAATLYRPILEAVPAGVVFVDATGAVHDANAAALRILGVTYEELVQRHVADFAGETLREDGSPCPSEEYPIARCIATGEPQPPKTIGVRRRDGRVTWSIFTAIPVRDPDTGALRGAVVTFPDVSPLKDAEARLRSVLDSAPNVILSVDRTGRIHFVNDVRHGIDPAGVVGKTLFDFLHPEDEPIVRAALAQAIDEGRVTAAEMRVNTPEGSRIYCARYGPVRDGDAITGVTVISWDVTEQRQLEARLAIADRMASVGQLAAGVAHEINNPLTYLLGSLELLERRFARGAPVEIDAVRGALGAALEGATRIRQVVRDLGTYSHAGERRAAAVDVRPLLDSAVRMAQGELRCRARVVCDYGDVPRVWASDARLGQVFLNLVVNAAQSIPEGNVDAHEVRISTRTEGGQAVIEISDTGAGIREELLGSIFDPFVTTKPPGVGTGLGLFICRNIVNELGGTIVATSALGRGSCFRVALPVGGEPTRVERVAPAASPRRRRRVLVVDDEPGIVRLLEQLLDAHDVVTASTGRRALELLAEEDFDAVLCDLVMPDLTGMDVYDELRRREDGRAERIVFMTGGAFTSRARAFLESVPARVVLKPFTAGALEDAIASIP